MTKSILFFIFVFTGMYCQYTTAQTKNSIEIKGVVKDSWSLEPLSYAHVRVKAKPIGVATNKEGKFSLLLAGQMIHDSLQISLIGYVSKTVAINELLNASDLTLLLSENTSQLEEVIVTAPDVENIVKEVSKRLKETFPEEPFEFEGYYRNAYRENNTYVRSYETAFAGFDKNYHKRNDYSVARYKERESKDYRKSIWRQSQGNITWHYLWHVRRQHHHFFVNNNYRDYKYTIDDITYFEGEEVYKIGFVLKDQSRRITKSWVFVRARDYAILEIGGKTKILDPPKNQLGEDLFVAYTGSSVLVKYMEHEGKMYPYFSASVFEHKAYNAQSQNPGSLDMNEELFIHEIKTPGSYSNKRAFGKSQQEKILNLPADSLFWKQYNKPVETALSRAIEKDLSAQEKTTAAQADGLADGHIDKPIALEQLKEDFTLFRSSLQEAHPSLYRYTSEQELNSLLDSTYKILTKPLSEIEFYALLTPVLSKIRCGHTGSMSSEKFYDTFFKREIFLPFQIKYVEDELYIMDVYDPSDIEWIGTEILSINGLSAKDIVGRIYPHLTADGYIITSKYQELANNFIKLYSLYIEQADTFNMEIKGKDEVINVPATSYEHYQELGDENELVNDYRLLDAKTAFLKIGSFTDTDYQPFKVWIEEIFLDVIEKEIANLIIDIRDNEGGRGDYALYLLQFLAKSPFEYQLSLEAATDHYSFLSFTDQDEYLNALMLQIVEKDTLGRYILRDTHPTLGINHPRPSSFGGKVYVLINGNTFSAAADFAAIASELSLAEFVGEETGGAFEGNASNGEILLTLPNSGIRVGIPLFQIKNAVSKKHVKGRGTVPEHITTYTVGDFLQKKDKELELVRSIISTTENMESPD